MIHGGNNSTVVQPVVPATDPQHRLTFGVHPVRDIRPRHCDGLVV